MARIVGFLRNTFRAGMPLRIVANHRQQNRIANILSDIVGVGCRIEKPINAEGRGWRIVIDGTSDEEYPDGSEPPFGAFDDGEYRYQVPSWNADGTNETWQPDWVRAHG